MDDIAILLEHVDLLNGLDRLDIELLQRGLQLLVVGAGGLVHFLDFSPWCTFPSDSRARQLPSSRVGDEGRNQGYCSSSGDLGGSSRACMCGGNRVVDEPCEETLSLYAHSAKLDLRSGSGA